MRDFTSNKLIYTAVMIRYVLTRHDIYLLLLGFHPVAVVCRLAQKWGRDGTKGETIHRTIQKTIKNTEYTK